MTTLTLLVHESQFSTQVQHKIQRGTYFLFIHHFCINLSNCAYSKSFSFHSVYVGLYDLEKRVIKMSVLIFYKSIYCEHSSPRDDSNEYQQHMLWTKSEKNINCFVKIDIKNYHKKVRILHSKIQIIR